MAKRRWRRSKVSPDSMRRNLRRSSVTDDGGSCSIYCASSAKALFHFVDVEPHGAWLPSPFGDREDPVEPVVSGGCGLETHHSAEIIMTGIDILAPRQFFEDLWRTVPQS